MPSNLKECAETQTARATQRMCMHSWWTLRTVAQHCGQNATSMEGHRMYIHRKLQQLQHTRTLKAFDERQMLTSWSIGKSCYEWQTNVHIQLLKIASLVWYYFNLSASRATCQISEFWQTSYPKHKPLVQTQCWCTNENEHKQDWTITKQNPIKNELKPKCKTLQFTFTTCLISSETISGTWSKNGNRQMQEWRKEEFKKKELREPSKHNTNKTNWNKTKRRKHQLKKTSYYTHLI